MPPRQDLRDGVRGALIGAVVGDAFGSVLEGASDRTIAQLVDRRALSRGPWGYTDDGSMFIALAESIRDCGTVSPVHALGAFSRRYEPARGFGRGVKLAIRAFDNGMPWRDVAHAAWPEGSQGNGGAVRVGAVALRRWSAPRDLIDGAALATRLTHAHPDAIDAALLHARLAALAIFEPDVFTMPSKAIDRVEADVPRTSFVTEALSKVRNLTATAGEVDIALACGTSTLARESVLAAHATFLRSHATFQDAIVTAAALGGDVDSICALVGCLAGAVHGLSGVPSSWIDAIAHESPSPAELADLADAVFALPPTSFQTEAV